MKRSAPRLAILAAAALALLSGCIPGYVRVVLQNAAGTNGGAPFYLLARKVEPKDHAARSYSEVARFLDLPDGSVLRTQLLYPGRAYHFYLKKPDKEALGLYFMFTDPGGAWSLLLARPLPWQVKAQLRGNIVMRELVM